MRAKVWKRDGIWWYKTYDPPGHARTALAVYGRRGTWRAAFDAACQELLWQSP